MSIALQCNNVSKRIIESNLTVIENINFSVKIAATFAITGRSGSGKSTLLSILAGLSLPSSGSVFVFDNEITQMNEEQRAELRLTKIGFIFQDFQLLNNLTVLDNVRLPFQIMGVNNNKDRAIDLLEKVGLIGRMKHYPNQISGGEAQRVSIARALANEPKLLFADEPTGNLDNKTANKIIDLMFYLNESKNTTLILVTHDLELAKNCNNSFRIY